MHKSLNICPICSLTNKKGKNTQTLVKVDAVIARETSLAPKIADLKFCIIL